MFYRMFKVCKVIMNTNTTDHLLEATGINLNVYVVVGCVGGVVVGLLNLHNQSDMLTHSL